MTYILENGNTPIAVEPQRAGVSPVASSVFTESATAMPLYGLPTLSHTIANGGSDKIWSFHKQLSNKALSDVGSSVLEVPSWCNAVMFLTTLVMPSTVDENYIPMQEDFNELVLYAYVPVSSGSSILYPETKIGSISGISIVTQPNIRKDIGGGLFEVMCKPAIIPTCGFQYVVPQFHGIACADVDKAKVQGVTVWAVPVNNRHHCPVI